MEQYKKYANFMLFTAENVIFPFVVNMNTALVYCNAFNLI
jgi:hypothetical protein